jgi:hypothetical protein
MSSPESININGYKDGDLEELLLDEGFIRYIIGDEGLKIELTAEGYEFFSQNGPGNQLLSQWTVNRTRDHFKHWFRKHIMLVGFFIWMFICFLINIKKSNHAA